MKKKNIKKGLLPYLFLLILVAAIYYILSVKSIKVNELTYDKLVKEVQEQNIKKVTITPNTSESVYTFEGTLKSYGENEKFKVVAPYSETVLKTIIESDSSLDYEIKTNADPGSGALLYLLVNVVPLVIIFGAGYYFLSKQMGSAGKSMEFGKSKAKLSDEKNKTNCNRSNQEPLFSGKISGRFCPK